MNRTLKRLVPALVLALLLAAAVNLARLPGCPVTARKGTVLRVYDADTLEVKGYGKVRLIGVDAPDGHNREKIREQAGCLGLSGERVVHWAGRATEFVRERVLHRRVSLERGPRARGDYGRLLAYVSWPKGGSTVELNRLLLEKGLAVAYRVYDHGRREEFIAAEKKARGQEASYR